MILLQLVILLYDHCIINLVFHISEENPPGQMNFCTGGFIYKLHISAANSIKVILNFLGGRFRKKRYNDNANAGDNKGG